MIGNTIGDYRILEKRGEGGMGMFFKAQDTRLDRLVGIKTIRAELLHEPEILAKLEEEAKSLARLDHPNIARLLHYMVIGDQRYIVMEYVEGADLAEKLRREGPLPLDLLAHIVPQICVAIGYAHNRHVIHRDIKPSNILLTEDNTVKVTDFGIAKILGVSAKTKTGVATGSLPYMAPEQIRGQGVDQRTDIYQLGVMFFELLTGRRPFLAETEYDMMSHHLSTPPPVPSSINPSIPKAMDQVILKALAKNPAERFESTAKLADAFKDAAGGEDKSRTVYRIDRDPITANTSTARRKRLIGGIVIAVLAILAFVKVFLLNEQDGTEQDKPTIATVSVTLSAALPAGVENRSVSSSRLLVTHPTAGTFESDSVRLVGEGFEGSISLPPADSIRFILSGYDAGKTEIVRGERWVKTKDQTSIQLDMRLVSLIAPASEPKVGDQIAQQPATAATPPKPQPPPVTDQPTPANNLTIDVQPFSERERVESVWLDGKKQSANFPLGLNAKPGLRKISWQIGDDIWTDTVTVGAGPVEKNLVFEMSRGRVNVAVTFPDGPGYAEIWLDGRETGQGTPGELRDIAAGPHEVTLKREGYRMQGGPQIVRVPANDRARISIPMAPR